MYEHYRIEFIKNNIALPFIQEYHYSKGMSRGGTSIGLFINNELMGVCIFQVPCSEAVRSSVFGAEHKDAVRELHRLALHPDCVPNTASWFVTKCIPIYLDRFPATRAIISFADSTEGHAGYIYQALNFVYSGTTHRCRFYRDSNGVLRHPRQSGVNISITEAAKRGWVPEMRDGKHRYILVVGPNKSERRKYTKLLKHTPMPYPKQDRLNSNFNTDYDYITKYLSKDLLLPEWIDLNTGLGDVTGYCYVVCEVIHRIDPSTKTFRSEIQNGSHWFVMDRHGCIIDPTRNQFETSQLMRIYASGIETPLREIELTDRAKVLFNRISDK